MGQGPGLVNKPIGSKGGIENAVLTEAQLPSHTHPIATHCVSGAGNTNVAEGNVWSKDWGVSSATYSDATPGALMSPGAVTAGNTGGNQPLNNMQPYQTVNFVIALVGLYPSRN
jgi:microcystin-dependent protein